jgi:hypothetical protein
MRRLVGSAGAWGWSFRFPLIPRPCATRHKKSGSASPSSLPACVQGCTLAVRHSCRPARGRAARRARAHSCRATRRARARSCRATRHARTTCGRASASRTAGATAHARASCSAARCRVMQLVRTIPSHGPGLPELLAYCCSTCSYAETKERERST